MAFRRASALLGSFALVAAIGVPTYAQDKAQDKPQEKRKLSKDEMSQYEGIRKIVDAVQAGKQPAPADFKITFRNHFLKSNDSVYLPFTIDLEPGKVTSVPAVMYVRAVAKGAAAQPKPAPKPVAEGEAPAAAPAVIYPWEDIAFVTPSADNTVQRALALPSGDYDLYIGISEKPSKDKKAPPAKTSVLTQTLNVPNLQSGLATSSILLAKNVEPGKQLTGQQQLEQPYMLSGYNVSLVSSTKYPKTAELLWVYYIYNEGAAANGKPDLLVEYNFFHAGEDKPFVNMPPSAYNATSNLPAEFNLASGHTVFVAQGVPLTTFEPGDYKLQIKITDNTNKTSITRDVPFSVTP